MCTWKDCVFCCFWMKLMGCLILFLFFLLVSTSPFVLVDICHMFTFPYVSCIYVYNCYILYHPLKYCVLSLVSCYCLCFKFFRLILATLVFFSFIRMEYNSTFPHFKSVCLLISSESLLKAFI